MHSTAVAEHGMADPGFGGHAFRDPGLLRLALTHRSCGTPNNERLEFLGDAVLGLVMAELLYDRFPAAAEGELSRLRARLVSGDCLAQVALAMEVHQRVRLGRGERHDGGARRKTILAGALEALIGAIWIDGGLDSCRACIRRWFAPAIEATVAAPGERDAKTRLQEYLQARGEPLPVYEVTRVWGPDHARRFEVSCVLALLDQPVTAAADSRREAEKRAAAKALALLVPEART
jgi:ribonuclease-3